MASVCNFYEGNSPIARIIRGLKLQEHFCRVGVESRKQEQPPKWRYDPMDTVGVYCEEDQVE